MESLKNIYNLLPMILNCLLSGKYEQTLSYDQLTKSMVNLCSYINGNNVPMSRSGLKNIKTTEFDIKLEALIISAFLHYQGRINQSHSDDEKIAYLGLTKAMKNLHIKNTDLELLKAVPRAHVLKVLFNINLINHSKAA